MSSPQASLDWCGKFSNRRQLDDLLAPPMPRRLHSPFPYSRNACSIEKMRTLVELHAPAPVALKTNVLTWGIIIETTFYALRSSQIESIEMCRCRASDQLSQIRTVAQFPFCIHQNVNTRIIAFPHSPRLSGLLYIGQITRVEFYASRFLESGLDTNVIAKFIIHTHRQALQFIGRISAIFSPKNVDVANHCLTIDHLGKIAFDGTR